MDNKQIDFIFLTGDNCKDFPKGGITSFTLQMMQAFGNKMALVGVSTDETPVGRWIQKDFDGTSYLFFSIAKVNSKVIKPILPIRLTSYFQLKKYKTQILELNVNNVFIQNSHFLLATKNWPIQNKAYIFHGVSNPLSNSRYRFAKYLSKLYEKNMFKSLGTFNTIFAAADEESIKQMIIRSNQKIDRKAITELPTRFDDKVFFPVKKDASIQTLGLNRSKYIFTQVGRISNQKGCDFIINSFFHFIKKNPDSMLYLVGDGEEKENILKLISSLKLNNKVIITGFVSKEKVASYYNSSDLVLVGSHMEGWSVSMVEALACGKTIVSTNVSGANDMIIPEKNGLIVKDRKPSLFAAKMEKALSFKSAQEHSLRISKKYSLSTLKVDIIKHWKTD